MTFIVQLDDEIQHLITSHHVTLQPSSHFWRTYIFVLIFTFTIYLRLETFPLHQALRAEQKNKQIRENKAERRENKQQIRGREKKSEQYLMLIAHYHLVLKIEMDSFPLFWAKIFVASYRYFCCYLERKIAIGFLDWKRESSGSSQILITRTGENTC
ncbi:hypothetical protein AVEN_48070-1 [Araneus ventricosus]|uniref:Uncharacterized protein n=1 Tax=Araneus ventricosus TaxID=182803 RepID=A0A4Y2NUB9_ARAVE|nr:hypothetical protein AVEN_48070-1 [Araneus ventricosus]